MPLPTLKELKKALDIYNRPRPYRPSRIWTRTDALAMKPKTLLKAELEEIRTNLAIKKSVLKPLAFFFNSYANKKKFVSTKYTPDRRILVAKGLYKATTIMFNSREICEFTADVDHVVAVSCDKWGRVLSIWRPLGKFSVGMSDLRDFWELNMQTDGAFLDTFDYEVNALKKSMIKTYQFMKCRGVD